MDGESALGADADRLAHRREEPPRLVAHVRVVDAAVLRRDLRQLDDFLGLGVVGRDVEESGREAERAVLHRLAHEVAHFVEFLDGGGAVLHADHPLAGPRVAGEEADVGRDLEVIDVLAQRVRLVAAVERGEDGRDPLADEVLGQRPPVDLVLDVVVVVDESRRDDEAGGVDLLGPLPRQPTVGRDLDDAVVADPHVGGEAVGPRSVHDGPAQNYKIERSVSGAGSRGAVRRLRDPATRGERDSGGRRQGPQHREAAHHRPLVLVCARAVSHTGTPSRL